jgi:membrane protease subunit HflK
MTNPSGPGARVPGLFIDGKGPWGSSDNSPGSTEERPPEGDGGSSGDGPGPWGDATRRRRSPIAGGAGNASLEDLLRRSRARFGGNLPGSDRSWLLWAVLGMACLWLVLTSIHSIGPGERGVVTRFGRYSGTLGPGVGITLPSPIERVKTVNVDTIRSVDLGSGGDSDLMLTGDQNLIDVAYSVRWNIRTPELYLFQIAKPDETISQAAATAMRTAIGRVSFNDAVGDKRSDIGAAAAAQMQRILDRYHSGIQIQGVTIRRVALPDALSAASKDVAAAQQEARSNLNQANTYASEITAKAQREAASFDAAYAQYKVAPEVTRRRMYYETMEQVLAHVDKTIVDTPGASSNVTLPQAQRSVPKAPAQ